MTGNDPADVGATHDTDADASPATARADVGAPGGNTGGGVGDPETTYAVVALPPTASTVIE